MKVGSYTIKLVNDNDVKLKYDMDFTEGANSMAKPYVPDHEIWISENVPESKRDYVIMHEIVEDILMRHRNNSYNMAHEKANVLEEKAREVQK